MLKVQDKTKKVADKTKKVTDRTLKVGDSPQIEGKNSKSAG
ncbi:hypothetical protein [Lysinibacillus sp. FSL W7-1291]